MVFYVPHAAPVFFPSLKQKIINSIGLVKWRSIYSIFSLLGIVTIIWGWIIFRPQAPDVYYPPSWASHITALFIWVGFILFLVTKKQPGRILLMVKHPMMAGTLLWSIGHLISNGDLASILLFGSFVIYAIISLIFYTIKGNESYELASYRGDISALAFGTIIFLIFGFYFHGWIFGVSPF